MKKNLFFLIIFFIIVASKHSHAQTAEPAKPAAPVAEVAPATPVPAAAPSTDATAPTGSLPTTPPASAGEADSEYEIDYEEEPESGDDEAEAPVAQPKTPKGKRTAVVPGGGSGGIQGSRAKHRFTPILKSETKSIYKKDGKTLDVDSD